MPGRNVLDVGPSRCVGTREHSRRKAPDEGVQALEPEVPHDDVIPHEARGIDDGPQRKILLRAEELLVTLACEDVPCGGGVRQNLASAIVSGDRIERCG